MLQKYLAIVLIQETNPAWFLPLLVVFFNTRWQSKCIGLYVKDFSSHLYPIDTSEPMFYSDEHRGFPSAAGEGPVALPKGGRHLFSHAWEIHLQSACQRRWSNPEVIQPVTHRHSFIIQQQQLNLIGYAGVQWFAATSIFILLLYGKV